MNWSLLLLFAGMAMAQDESTETDETLPQGTETGAEDETPETVENQEGDDKKTATFEPAGALTRDYQYIFSQGTMSFDGFDIVSPTNLKTKIGRLDGQTGWTGINQAGEKTMSYQIAFVIKSDNKLTSLFNRVGQDGRKENQTTQLGWWIPGRGEDIPPEDWTMNLMDMNMQSTVTKSTIRYLQTEFKEGLYDDVGGRIDAPYNLSSGKDKEQHETEWKFDQTTGQLISDLETTGSVKGNDEYFVSIKDKTSISEDRLVISIEGTSLKQNLPEIRWGTKLPFYFQILDYEPKTKAWIIRQRNIVELTFGDDPNSCTLPAVCIDPEAEEDNATAFSLLAATSVSLLSVALF